VSQRKLDDNDLAQFLDSRLSKEGHDSTLAHLVDSDADLEVLGDAAFLLDDLGEEDQPPGDAGEGSHPRADHPHREPIEKVTPLPPPSTRRRWRRAPAQWMALAAVLAGVLLVPLALSRSGARDPGDFATLLASRDAGLPSEDWVNRSRWPVTRGDANVAAENARAAQLGALQVDLEVAAAAGDAEQTHLSATRIAEMLNMPGSGAVAAAYRDIAGRAEEPAQTLASSVADARESLALFVDEDHFSLGAWAEAASIAVQRRDIAFFRSRASRKLLGRAASLPSLGPETHVTVQAIQTAAGADQPDWTVLADRSDALLRQIAR
jgi:hypothetical protein